VVILNGFRDPTLEDFNPKMTSFPLRTNPKVKRSRQKLGLPVATVHASVK